MSGSIYKVPGLSRKAIRQQVDRFRSALGLADEPFFPIMDVLEHVLDAHLQVIRLEVWEDRELGGAEGLSFRDEDGVDRIVLPQSVYHSAWEGDPRARFTASHEVGHWNLHSQVVLRRVQQSQLKGAFEDPEWQANTFAAELLMPVRFIRSRDGADDLCERFGVSGQAANLRLQALRKEGVL